MSYDIDVVRMNTVHSANYTSNVGRMYSTAFDTIEVDCKAYYSNWKDAISGDRENALIILGAMIAELRRNPSVYEAMNPSNGWGHYEGAVEFLDKAYRALLKFDDAKIFIDY